MQNEEKKTVIAANIVSNTVITKTFPLFCLKTSSLKYSPDENAINARAISERKSIPSTTVCGTRFRQKLPRSTPASIYAVTFGRCRCFVILVAAKPVKNMRATEIMTEAMGDVPRSAV